MRFDGLKIVVDCAHGAAYKVAPQVLWELGAEVIAIGVQPDGININDNCGATAPAQLREAVLKHQADLGIALDGDADRLIMVDEQGRIVDGDNLMALIAQSWQEDGKLKGGSVVSTQMSNIGLERYLNGLGIPLIRTNVGDRYVLEAMQNTGCNFGGEQSGHLILTDYSSTGDGLIAALQILRVLMKKGGKFSKISHVFTPVPQLLRNVRMKQKIDLTQESIRQVIQDAEARLHQINGRLLIRPSGTEPLLRIMAEADDPLILEAVVSDIEAALMTQ
jgi:phosphoglucosamine mutase